MSEQIEHAAADAATNGQAQRQERVGEAKGRPMLHWVGKHPLDYVTAYPAQEVERFDPTGSGERGNLLFHGDNKDVLAWLLANGYRGKLKLVFIDPPFDSGANYVRQVSLRGVNSARIAGETNSLGEQIQYADIWANDTYLQFMYERLLLIRQLLNEQAGFVALQCDSRRSHYLRIVLDETFGADNFRGEILVRAGVKNVQSQFDSITSLSTGNNSIFLYTTNTETKLRKLVRVLDSTEPGKWDTFWRGTNRPTMRYELFGQLPTEGQWRWTQERTERAVDNYRKYRSQYDDDSNLDNYFFNMLEKTSEELDFVRKDQSGTVQYYVPPRNYQILSNVWFDVPYRGNKTDYPTEKSEAPTERLVKWLTDPNDLVLDCFSGSGTTAAVAQKLGRRWIAADINKGAVQTTSKRLQTIILEQIEAQNGPRQPGLLDVGEGEAPPAALSFTHFRVNDYDLTIQHNEALQLAAEHIGFQRAGDDPFFEGRLGQRLVRLVPFNHPITRLDLEQAAEELKLRDETRDVVVVGLGKELAVDEWLADYNRRRPINRIELIELRTDEKYGQFFQHEPARAEVSVRREDDKIVVEIEDFISPTIVKRLEIDTPLFRTRIPDWRSMVDVILIDAAYDGEMFNITLSDVPQRKNDLVQGRYELPAPEGPTTVAVKIIDMLGEELLAAAEV